MTTVLIVKDRAGYISFESFGHSGYAEEGSDIVCASVSSATELVIDILERFSANFSLEIDNERAYVLCKLNRSKDSGGTDVITGVLDGYYRYIKDVAESYPKYLKCILTEV